MNQCSETRCATHKISVYLVQVILYIIFRNLTCLCYKFYYDENGDIITVKKNFQIEIWKTGFEFQHFQV